MQPPDLQSRSKSIFKSKTFWGAVFTMIVGVAPLVGQIANERQESGQTDWEKIAAIVGIIAGTGTTIVGRVTATEQVFTPDGLPGPNKGDFRL